MKTLYLLRHAKSAWSDPSLSDHERPLNKRGRNACKLLAGYWRSRQVTPALVLCSTAQRARETLLGIAQELGRELPVKWRDDLYTADPDQMLALVRRQDSAIESLMLVGHNPGMAMLAERLARPQDRDKLLGQAGKFPTGALATLVFDGPDWRDAAPGEGRLADYVAPKLLGD